MSTDAIASLSTAMSQAQLQSAVATKVLKLAQGSDQQLAAKLLGDALDNAQETIQQYSEDLGTNLDTLA